MRRRLIIGLVVALCVVAAASLVLAGSRSSAWLGIHSQRVDRQLARDYDLAVNYGAIVNDVAKDSPAEKAGIEEDDVIVRFNDDKVRDDDDLVDLVRDSRPGDEVTLTVRRGADELKFDVELGTRPRGYHRYDSDDDDDVWILPRASRAPKAPKAPHVPRLFSNWSHYSHYSDYSDHGYLGIRMVELSRPAAQSLGAERDGILIDEVDEDSPAEKAGLKPGDLIVAVDGERVADAEDVQEIVWDMEEGDTLAIDYVRNHKAGSVKVELSAADRGYHRGGFGYIHIPEIPAIPEVPRIPEIPNVDAIRSLGHGYYISGDDFDFDFDASEFHEEMKELQSHLRVLQGEMKDVGKRVD